MAYLDSSIVVAYYCPEKLSEKIEKIILADPEPAISTLTAVEFASAISRKHREKNITNSDARIIWQRFTHHRTNGYYLVNSVEINHYTVAASLIMHLKTPLRALDALHLATAHELSMPIVTSDKILAQSAEKLGIIYILVE